MVATTVITNRFWIAIDHETTVHVSKEAIDILLAIDIHGRIACTEHTPEFLAILVDGCRRTAASL